MEVVPDPVPVRDEAREYRGVSGGRKRARAQCLAEIGAFVSQPVNSPYIELARKLSAMSTERLRSVAENLLDITF